MRKTKRIVSAITILPTLALLCWTYAYVSRVSREFSRRIPGLLSAAVEERVNGKVTLGTAEVHPLGVVINGATLHDGKKQVIRVKQIKIACRISDIISGRTDPVKCIRRIELVEPEVRIERFRDGKWNVNEIVKSRPTGKPQFNGKVFLTSAQVLLVDHMPDPAKPMKNRLSKVNAVIDYARVTDVEFDIWGLGQPNRFRRFAVKGSYGLTTRIIDADIQISDGSARYLASYPFHVGLNIVGGRADGEVALHKAPDNPHTTYNASVRLTDGIVRFKELKHPITSVDGDILVRDNFVSVDAQARLQSTPFTIRGTVADFKRPKLALAAQSNAVNLKEALSIVGYKGSPKQLSLPRTGRLNAVISGPLNKYRVTFDTGISSIKSGGIIARSFSAQGSYTGGVISVNRAHAVALGGSLDGSANIKLGKHIGAFITCRATGLNLRTIPSLSRSGVKGTANGKLTASINKKGTNVAFTGATGTINYGGITIEQPKISASYNNGRIVVDGVSAHTMGGMVAASGLVGKDGKLNLKVSGADINLAAITALSGNTSVVGHGEFEGRITGKPSDPSFAGVLDTDNLMISGVGIGRAEGVIRVSKREIVIEGMRVDQCPGSLTLSGRIQLTGKTPNANLTLTANSFDVGNMLEFGGRYIPQDGKFSGEVTMAGPLNTPVVLADLQIDGGLLQGIELDKTDIRLSFDSDGYKIDSITTKSGKSAITLTGTVATDGKLDLSINSQHLALSDLGAMFSKYSNLTGEASVTGHVGGTVDSVTAALSVESSAVNVNGQPFSHLAIKAGLENNVLTLYKAEVTTNSSRYALNSLVYDGNSDLITVSASTENGRLEHLIKALSGIPEEQSGRLKQFLERLPKPVSGQLDVHADGNLLLKYGGVIPDLRLGVMFSDMKFGKNTFKSITLNGTWKDDVGVIENLRASDGDMVLAAQGSIGPLEKVDITLDAKNMDVATMNKWLGMPDNFSGKADVTLIAGGTTRTPTAEMNLDIAEPAIGTTKFDRLNTKLVLTRTEKESEDGQSVKEDRISISDLTLHTGDQMLKVSGYIPVDLHTLALKRDVPLLVETYLDSSSLAILSKFSGLNMETASDGSFSGHIKLSGYASDPTLEGTLNWTKGLISIPRLNSPMKDITAHLTLSDDKVTIREISGSSAEGGTFTVAGTASFEGWNPTLDLGIKTDALRISGRNLSNIYGEDVRMRIQSDIKIANNWRTPSVSGTADLSEGSVALPRKPLKKQPKSDPFPLNPKFDVNVKIGQDVRFAAARLKAVMTGYMNVMGTLTKPNIDSSMEITSGAMLFPTRRFKIMPGSMMTIHIPSQQSSVYVDLTAQSHITMMAAFGRPRRYTVTMSAQGPLDRMNPDFTSSPPGLSQQQMVGMMAGQTELESLLANQNSSQFGHDLSSVFSSAVLPSVFEPIEESLADTLGLSEFSLEMGYQEPLMLTIGQRLSGNFYLDYSQVLGARPDYSDSSYRLKLSYRWKHGMEFGLETDENKAVTLGIEGKLRF